MPVMLVNSRRFSARIRFLTGAADVKLLLQQPRVADTYAVEDGTRILSLSERTLRDMIADDPVVAAKLLLNLAKMLSVRLSRAW